MYAAGAAHPNKEASARLLERVADGSLDAATDVEVLQEILHRYRAIRRWEDGRQVYDLVRLVVPTIHSIKLEDLDEARLLMDRHSNLPARDALHAAICLSTATDICSYDKHFDQLAELRRLEPSELI